LNTTIANHPPIVSLSLNPAIDLTYELKTLTHDQKTRALNSYYDPGGTGINVGRALQMLNANSKTCYVTAGKMGEFLDVMIKQVLNNTYRLDIEGETRINTTLLQSSPNQQYEVNATGPTINPAQLEKIIQHFLSFCKQGIAVLTGSLPLNTAADTYNKINIRMQQQGGRCIIDAPIAILKHSLNSQPFLIKPNLHELETLQNKALKSIEDIALEARQLVQQGCHNVCVSLGEEGAILCNSTNSYFANTPKILVHSTVGAGDSVVAGLAYGFANQQNPEDILKLAIACGSGTAQQPGTQLFKLKEIEILKQQIIIKTLNI
jgi:6-phosphofructokinase 2